MWNLFYYSDIKYLCKKCKVKFIFGCIILIDLMRDFWFKGVESCLRFFFRWFWSGLVGLGVILGLNFRMVDIVIVGFILVSLSKKDL